MVYLSRIYTRTGDQGETSLGDGGRVPKDHPRVAAYGSVDELNAVVGLLLTQGPAEADLLRSIQNDLFDVGADLCRPQPADEAAGQRLRVRPEQGQRLEAAIDRFNARLEPLKSFVLPGGSAAAAWCHLARTVRRRSHYPTLVALNNSQHKVEQSCEETLTMADYLLERLQEIREHARKERANRR